MKFELSNFSDSHFHISVHFNMGNLTKEKQIYLNMGESELSEIELTRVNCYKMYYQIQGKLDSFQVSGKSN